MKRAAVAAFLTYIYLFIFFFLFAVCFKCGRDIA